MVKSRIWLVAGALALVALLTGRSFAENAARTQHAAIGVSARVDVSKRYDYVAKRRGPMRSAAIRKKKKSGHAQYGAEKVPQPADMGKRHDHVAKRGGPVRSVAMPPKTKSGSAQHAVKQVQPQADARMDIDREPDPVRSLLEIRRANVMIQNWDLSCGAAALGTLLRYEFGEPVTEKEIARGLMSQIGRAHV